MQGAIGALGGQRGGAMGGGVLAAPAWDVLATFPTEDRTCPMLALPLVGTHLFLLALRDAILELLEDVRGLGVECVRSEGGFGYA